MPADLYWLVQVHWVVVHKDEELEIIGMNKYFIERDLKIMAQNKYTISTQHQNYVDETKGKLLDNCRYPINYYKMFCLQNR